MTDVLLFAMAMIWGINFVVVKYATHIFNPVAFTGLRVGTVAVFLVIFALSRGAPAKSGAAQTRVASRVRVNRSDVWRLLLLGVLGNGLYQLFFVHGVARTRAGNAALIVGAAPAFIALVARARGMERVKRIAGAERTVVRRGGVVLADPHVEAKGGGAGGRCLCRAAPPHRARAERAGAP